MVRSKAILQWREPVQMVKFAHVTTQQKGPYMGRNVHIGRAVLITSRKSVTLKGSKHLHDPVNREGIRRTCSGRWRRGDSCVWTIRPSTHSIAHTLSIYYHAWVTYGLQTVTHVPHP
jgi:hypothetical protein